MADQQWATYLDSGALAGERAVSKHADYDVLAIKPERTIVTRGPQTTVTVGTIEKSSKQDPVSVLKDNLPTIDDACGQVFVPGALGYFSYDLARQFEQLPALAVDDEQLPEMAMGVYHAVVVIDHAAKSTSLIYIEDSPQAAPVVTEWRQRIDDSLDEQNARAGQDYSQRLVSGTLDENMSRTAYREKFDKVRGYTVDGDCYQVNLAKQFSTKVEGDAWATYQRLRTMSPAPYGAYFNFPFAQVLSNSPESFIQCRGGAVVTSPIKGTAARDHDDIKRDKAIAQRLRTSSKDRAENLMIVDLMRNDLSRCCELGSVKVPKLFALHSFANVHHLISTITGKLKHGMHALDLLRSCFPGGSITGAPKIRAMEIIEELEPHRRGLYCGAVAYVGMDGCLETNIAIRTITVKDGVARFSAGGGLVIDSDVNEEYQELLDKASMMTASLRN